MQATIRTVNAAGIEEIRAFLLANHKRADLYTGATKTTMDMLRAWAADAEASLSDGNDASIEIKSWDSAHGHTQTFTVSDVGIDTETVEIDE